MLRNKKGFTLVEAIVTITITTLLIGAVVLGLVQYSRYAKFKRMNEYAEQLFIAAQQELTVYSQLNNLEGLQKATAGNAVPLSSLTDLDGNKKTTEEWAEIIWPESVQKDADGNPIPGSGDSLYQGKLRYFTVTKEKYAEYLQAKEILKNEKNESPEKVKWANEIIKGFGQIYELFDSYVYNKDILADGAICVEFDPYEGMVYAVFYSDQAEQFTYTGETAGKEVNICNRTYDYRKENMVGYYGVDTLSKSTSLEAQKPAIANVKLNNEETLNLSFNLSKIPEATSFLNYELILYDASNNTPILSIEFNDEENRQSAKDWANYSLVAEDAQSTTCTVQARVYDYRTAGQASGSQSEEEKKENGKLYTFPAWIDASDTIYFVLDAVDLGATVMDAEAMEAGTTNEMKHTFSLHRFGIDAEMVYCTIVGQGGGYSRTSTVASNAAHAYFGKYRTSVLSNDVSYTLYNARHLYNMRFKEAGIGEEKTPVGQQTQQKVKYSVEEDLSWSDLIEAGAVYQAQDNLVTEEGLHWITEGNQNNNRFTTEMLKVSTKDKEAFPSIETLRSTSTLQSVDGGKRYSISGFSILRSTNRTNDNRIQLEDEDATGLFLRNDGTIQDLKFDQAMIVGEESVGTVCGQNNGVLKKLTVLNTDDKSSVTGTQYVGGIVGSQKKTTQSVTYDSLINRSSVTGYRYIGGMIGSLDSKSCPKITVTACENYGRVHGVTDENPVADKRIETAYIGGIAGYTSRTGGNQLEIIHCSSSPQYAEEDILNADRTAIEIERIGTYVGGIIGYNDGAVITECNTRSENGKPGYVIGDRFVGGIVGYNNGAAGVLDGAYDVNEAAVIGKTYVGGIVGANADMSADSETPSEVYDGRIQVCKWLNHGVVIAFGDYAGGISGFNAGQIRDCNSDVDYDETAQALTNVTTETGDYVGGIAGYNNGQITAEEPMSAVAVIKGNDYVGGIVGYNDIGDSCTIQNYELQGGYVTGSTFVGGYVGLNASKKLLDKALVSKPNSVTGEYCVGGIIGGNIVATQSDITTQYTTYNILGNINGTEFVGGFIGYNLLLSERSKVGETVATIQEVLTTDYKKNIQLLEKISSDCKKVLTITKGQVVMRQITADLYVGGVMGFNGANSYLYISNVTNRTPIDAKTAVSMDELENQAPDQYSYVGGVIGKVSQSVIIDNCQNAGVGEVHGKGTYTGGIAELNCGLIIRSNAASIGNNTSDQIGGIVGVNAPKKSSAFGSGQFVREKLQGQHCYQDVNAVYLGIYDCGYSGTITGHNQVGGLAAANYGTIYNPMAEGTITGYGDEIGGVVGHNYEFGTVTLDSTLTMKITGNGSYVGGVAGANEGSITILKGSEAAECATEGDSIVGTKYVGGIVGRTQNSIIGFVNATPVTASQGGVGGIAGIAASDKSFTIENCVNTAKIQATLSGNAGGIMAHCAASCTVRSCGNGGAVTASNGYGGGITAVNQGIVEDCCVSPSVNAHPLEQMEQKLWNQVSGNELTLTGDTVAGAITANNENVIRSCEAVNVAVVNLSSSRQGSELGGIAGTNSGKIILSDRALQDVTVSTYTDDSCVGGVVGRNRTGGSVASENGTSVVGTEDDPIQVNFADSSATMANFGGVAGENQGTISHCRVYGKIEGNLGNSRTPTNGYGGVAGVSEGEITACSFDGIVYGDGNSSLIACIGGIAGLNSGTVADSVIGITEGGITVIQSGTSNSAYGYVGGLVGYNKKTIRNCDNKKESHATVSIHNFGAGNTGGLVGKNYNKAVVSGTGETKLTTTGRNWTVQADYYDNDSGTGGIIGYSASGASIEYVENYAFVKCMHQAENVSVGGLIGRLENSESTEMSIQNCENYGDIYGLGLSGGFIGTVKYNGLTFRNCENYGKIGVDKTTTAASGLIGRMYLVGAASTSNGMDTVYYIKCANHGALYAKSAAGMLSSAAACDNAKVYFTDCVNTGCIYGTVNSAGISVVGVSRTYFYRCSNYGLCAQNKSEKFSGIYSNTRKAASGIVDCLDCSNATNYPITNQKNNASNNYYVCQSNKNVMAPKQVEIESVDTSESSYLKNVQDSYPLTKAYDGKPTLSATDTRDSATRLTAEGTGWGGSNQITLQFKLKDPTVLTEFGICWASGNNASCRRYTYKLYYQLEDETEWKELTTSNTDESNYPISYDATNQCYQAVAQKIGTASVESTVFHTFDLEENQKVTDVKIVVSKAESSSDGKNNWTANKNVVLGEVYPATNEMVEVVVPDDEYEVNTGIPLMTGYDASNGYTLTSAAGSGGDVELTHLKCNVGSEEYRTDYKDYQTKEKAYGGSGDASARYRVYYAVSQAYQGYLNAKYNAFTGTITIDKNSPTDVGDYSYNLSWTSTQTPYAYEVSYKIDDGEEVDYGTVLARTNSLYQTLQVNSKWVGHKVTMAVRAVYFTSKGEEGYQETYSDWEAAEEPFTLKDALPEPKVHLELVATDDTYRYKAVLENPEDYESYDPEKVLITVTGINTTTFYASDGESAATMDPATGNKTITFQAEFTEKDYGKSVKRTYQSMIFSVADLHDVDYATTAFDGFYGSSTSDLYYSTQLKKAGNTRPETYYYSELLAYDDDIGVQTAVSYSESHVTEYGGTMTATLTNLPQNLIQKLITDYEAGKTSSIQVRTYPWRTQAYMSYFGHTIAENISADKVKDTEVGGESIFDSDDALKSGYVIQKNSDATYTVIYSLIDEYSNYFAKQIDQVKYTLTETDGTYYLVSGSERIAVQRVPEISEKYDYDEETDQYTFYWDQNSAVENQTYQVTLVGISVDHTEVELSTLQTTEKEATFEDNNWDYPNLRLEVQCLGTTDSAGKTTAFAADSSRTFNLKTRLDTIAAPTVEFHEEGGIVEKNQIIYDVSWNGITNEALDCYEITVRYPHQKEEGEEGDVIEVRFNTGAERGAVYRNGEATGETAELSGSTKTGTSAVITLNCLSEYGGQEVDVMIRAIAKENSETYRNGADGVPRVITLPSRLATPDMSNLSCSPSADEILSVSAFENDGVTFEMRQEYTDKGSYQMVVEIVDQVHNKSYAIYVNGEEVTKENPITMAGNLEMGTYTLTGLSAKYAGMKLKVSMRAVADSNISSVWIDQDGEQYFQLPWVQVDTPAISEGTETITYTHDSESSKDWDYLNQTYLEFDPVDYANEYDWTIVGAGEEVDVSEEENHIREPVCQLRLVKSGDVYRVYAVATDDAQYGTGVEQEVGTLSEDLLALPIKRETTITDDNLESQVEVYAYMKLTNGKIRLILPDCEENEDRFTQNVTVQAIAEQQDYYVNSDFASWYRTTSNDVPVTQKQTYEEQPSAPKITTDNFVVEAIEGDPEHFCAIRATTAERVVYELSTSEKTRWYSVPGNSRGSNYDSVLLLDSGEWSSYAGEEVSLRMCYIIGTMGISQWSQSVTLTLSDNAPKTEAVEGDSSAQDLTPNAGKAEASDGTSRFTTGDDPE